MPYASWHTRAGGLWGHGGTLLIVRPKFLVRETGRLLQSSREGAAAVVGQEEELHESSDAWQVTTAVSFASAATRHGIGLLTGGSVRVPRRVAPPPLPKRRG